MNALAWARVMDQAGQTENGMRYLIHLLANGKTMDTAAVSSCRFNKIIQSSFPLTVNV